MSDPQNPPRGLEDLSVGQVFRSGSLTLDAAAIVGFARIFDPRPFHTDPEAESEILDITPSRSKSDRGVVTKRGATRNQNGEAVHISTMKLIAPRRPAG